MKLILIGAAAVLALTTAATPASALAAPEPESCVCTMDYQPVVGVDGRTYPNACAAGCAGVAVAHDAAVDLPVEPGHATAPDPCDSKAPAPDAGAPAAGTG